MKVDIEVLSEVTGEAIDAFRRLLPQLSTSSPPMDEAALSAILTAPASQVLVARSGGEIVGTLTVAMFPIPTGVRAWIEDVVVDEAVRGQGVGEALVLEEIRGAKDGGAKTVDLTPRPSREAAGRLYERLGFEQRETRLYRYSL